MHEGPGYSRTCAYSAKVCAIRNPGTMNENILLISLLTGCGVNQLSLRWLGIMGIVLSTAC